MEEQNYQNSNEHNKKFLTYKTENKNPFNSFLSLIDILGRKPKLLVGKSTRYKNATGGLMSILVMAIIIVLFYVFAIDMFYKLHPIVTSSTEYDIEAKRFTLTPENFAFWVGLEDKNYNYFMDPTVYNINIRWVSRTTDQKGLTRVEKFLKYQPCNQVKDFTSIFNGAFKPDDLKNLYCVDPSDPIYRTMNLTGSFENPHYDVLSIDFVECTNGTIPGVICKDKKTIDSILNEGYVAINYIDNIFNTNNYTDPAIKVKKNLYTISSNSFYKTWTIYMKNVDVVTDDEFIFSKAEEDRVKQTYLTTDYDKELSYATKGAKFLNLTFRLSSIRPVFLRTYKKIQDVIAQMNGFIYIVYYFFLYLIHYFDDVNMNKTLINYALSFGLTPTEDNANVDFLESEMQNMRNSLSGAEKGSSLSINNLTPSNVNVIKFEDKRGSGTLNEEVKRKRKETKSLKQMGSLDLHELQKEPSNTTPYLTFNKKKISFTCKEVITMAFCTKCNKNEDSVIYYKYGSKMITRIFDTRNILKREVELDLLKRVLFNKYQFKIFDLVTKSYSPSVETVNFSTVEVKDEENSVKIHKDLVNSYRRLEESEDYISESLRRLLDGKIRNALCLNKN